MESRGFRAYPRTMERFKMRPLDWAAGITAFLISALAVWLGR
jgi:energy-coupling factor transporter transmembrane protein EcfT